MPDLPDPGSLVVVHKAASSTEAMVIRGLLESAGIHSPEPGGADSSLTGDPGSDTAGVNIKVLQSQSSDALRIIAEYQSPVELLEIEPDQGDPPGTAGD